MNTAIIIAFSLCGFFLGRALFGNDNGIIGLLVGGFLGYKITEEQNKEKNQQVIPNIRTQAKQPQQILPSGPIATFIVGVTFDNRQSIVEKLSIDDVVLLVREPENPYDKNAIKVVVPPRRQATDAMN